MVPGGEFLFSFSLREEEEEGSGAAEMRAAGNAADFSYFVQIGFHVNRLSVV